VGMPKCASSSPHLKRRFSRRIRCTITRSYGIIRYIVKP
jgi:hypothetical protein